jgi:hypothetical protein
MKFILLILMAAVEFALFSQKQGQELIDSSAELPEMKEDPIK